MRAGDIHVETRGEQYVEKLRGSTISLIVPKNDERDQKLFLWRGTAGQHVCRFLNE